MQQQADSSDSLKAGSRQLLVAVGLACIDIVIVVPTYPQEDSEMRAIGTRKTRGGNATNLLAVAVQLGQKGAWIGRLADDDGGRFIQSDLRRYGISTELTQPAPGAATPTSYITLSQAAGTRTIVHHTSLPEVDFPWFEEMFNQHSSTWRWIHFEGRNLKNVYEMVEAVIESRMKSTELRDILDLMCSFEIEKAKHPWSVVKPIVELADVVFFSKDYARHLGHQDACGLFQQLNSELIVRNRPKTIICAWGERGAYATTLGTYVDGDTLSPWCVEKDMIHLPAFLPEGKAVVDTLGAGDTFNGAVLASLCAGKSLEEAVNRGCIVAGTKVTQRGLDGLQGLLDDVSRFSGRDRETDLQAA